MKVTEDNILFKYEDRIKKLCSPITKTIKLRYFSFAQIQSNGQAILLSTNHKVYMHHLNMGYPLTIMPKTNYTEKSEILNLLFVKESDSPLLLDEHRIFGHGNALDILRIHQNYYEMFCFVLNSCDYEHTNSYLNNLKQLRLFCDDFLEYFATDLQNVAATEKYIHLPQTMIPKLASIDNSNENQITMNGETLILSKRQSQCLVFLLRGKSLKEIGYLLGIAPSTVSDHITKLMRDLGVHSKSELMSTFKQSNINDLHYSTKL